MISDFELPRPLSKVWFFGFYSNDTNPSRYESMLNHTGRIPTNTDRVTYMDRDLDLSFSYGDEMLFWEENASHESQRYDSFYLLFGNPYTGFSVINGLALHDGFVWTCSAGSESTVGIVAFMALLVLIILIVAIAVRFGFVPKKQR